MGFYCWDCFEACHSFTNLFHVAEKWEVIFLIAILAFRLIVFLCSRIITSVWLIVQLITLTLESATSVLQQGQFKWNVWMSMVRIREREGGGSQFVKDFFFVCVCVC